MANTKIPVELSSTPGIVDNSNATAITIDSSENVGIGTDSPASKLHIFDGGSSVNNTITFGNPSATPKGEIKHTASGSEFLNISCKGTTSGFGNIAFYTGPTPDERMRIDSSGNVGIGETNPTKLGLTGSSTGKVLALGGDDCQLRLTYTVLHHDHSGNTTTHLRNHYGSLDALARMKLESGYITFHTGTAFTERVRINSSGGLLIGKTTAGSTNTGCEFGGSGTGGLAFNLTSTNECFTYNNNNSSGATYLIDFRQNNASKGQIQVSSTSTTYATSSDYRLKENVVEMTGALDRVNQLQPKRFNFIADETNTLVDGFIAHEVSDIVPEAVTGEKDGDRMQGIDQSKLVPLLTKAIQEQQAQIEALQSEINELKNS